MIIEKVNICEYKPLLTCLFAEDEDLLTKYHIEAGSGLNNCVDRTIKDFFTFSKYTLYKIVENGKTVAFFGKELVDGFSFMTGFFIKMEYRTKDFVNVFWQAVKFIFLSDTIFCNIYKKNARAFNFLNKNGELVLENDNVLTFKIN